MSQPNCFTFDAVVWEIGQIIGPPPLPEILDFPLIRLIEAINVEKENTVRDGVIN